MINADLYKPLVSIVAGDSGAGKSFFLYHHPSIRQNKRVIVLDMENRWNEMISNVPLDPLPKSAELIIPIRYTDNGAIDYLGTYNELTGFVGSVKKKEPELVIIDGISDIRTICHEAWCIMNNRKHAVSPFDWGQVNQLQRQILLNLINLARKNGFQLYMSVLLVESYDDSKSPESQYLNGLQLDIKRQIKANVDEIGIIYLDGDTRVYSRMLKYGAKSWRPNEEYDITAVK